MKFHYEWVIVMEFTRINGMEIEYRLVFTNVFPSLRPVSSYIVSWTPTDKACFRTSRRSCAQIILHAFCGNRMQTSEDVPHLDLIGAEPLPGGVYRKVSAR